MDVQREDAPDEHQLEFAASEGRVLFSYNASDFQRIHTDYLSSGKSHAGIILAPQQRYTVGEQIRLLLKLANARTSAEMHNRLEFLSDWV
jgi:Tfp pilus assembly protein PilZ